MAKTGPKRQTILVVGGGIAGVTAVIKAAEEAEADVISTPCPLCQTNVEMYQDMINKKFGTDFDIPVVFYSQLMAVAFGKDAKSDAALHRNSIHRLLHRCQKPDQKQKR